jgi:putative spermidine/putrescine transport system permease protein
MRIALRGFPIGIVPAVAFLVVFFLTPFVVLALYSFLTFKDGVIVAGPSFDGYLKLARDPFMWYIFGRTILLSFIVTGICLLFGYPLAYLFSKTSSPLWRSALVVCVTAPLLTSTLIRTFAWLVLLGREGLINQALIAVGILSQPIQMLYTAPAVVFAMAQVLLPFMAVPLITTLRSLPTDVEDAATNLGATRWRAFWEITLPLSLPGVAAGVTLVFILAYTMFTVPTLMGGAAFGIVSVYIWNSVNMLAWDTASQVASLLLISSLVIVTLLNMVFQKLAPWQYLHA